MSLVIDGVFLQLAELGKARIWRTILPLLAAKVDMPIVLLDRGGIGEEIAGVEIVPFPTYKAKFNTHDSALLERVCRHYDATVFISTHFTTPLQTPSLMLVYDMIPERLGFDLSTRDWREKEIAIGHARRHICISNTTRMDLLKYYPELDPSTTTVAPCGVDPTVFKPIDERSIADFRRRLNLARPYYLFVGSRLQCKNYKNASLFFNAMKSLREIDFDVLCVGGESSCPTSAQEDVDHKIIQVELDDRSLATAYSGALALVYPSLYEGFGLPLVEAMSCGCPVISTSHGSLAEVAGDAALTIGGSSVTEMVDALRAVLKHPVRERLIASGLKQAAMFRWQPFTDEVAFAIRTIALASRRGSYLAFYEKWAELRALQGEVDILA